MRSIRLDDRRPASLPSLAHGACIFMIETLFGAILPNGDSGVVPAPIVRARHPRETSASSPRASTGGPIAPRAALGRHFSTSGNQTVFHFGLNNLGLQRSQSLDFVQ